MGLASGAPAVEILTPQSHVSMVLPRVHVVGRTTASEVVVRLNGETIGPVTVRDSVFHQLIWMPFGLNEITVMTPAALLGDTTLVSPGDWGPPAASVQVLCGPRIPSQFQKVFTNHVFHDDDGDASCLACHRPGFETGEAQDSAWCLECHPVIKEQFVSHTTRDMAECTNCHRIEADLTAARLSDYSGMNPCYLCHKDKIGQFAQDYIHGPVAGGTCTVCHNPHGSRFAKNLRTPVPVLCQYCHTEVGGSTAAVQHKPFRDGQCVVCHDPHATGNRWVLVSTSSVLCVKCHDADEEMVRHEHPFGVKPRLRMETNLPLTDKGKLECLTCHHAHGSEAPFLLKSSAENMCLGCHPGKE